MASRRSERTRGDAALVHAALRGEGRAVRAFVARMRCVPRMLAAKNRQLGRPLKEGDLEDLVQETLAAVWRKLPQYTGAAALETWVYQFCFLELMRRLRVQRRLPHLLDDGIEGSPLEPSAPPEPRAVDFEHVTAGLAALETELADVLRLKHYEGLTFEALAARLGIPTNTAKTRYYRGLRKLRGLLGETREEPVERRRP